MMVRHLAATSLLVGLALVTFLGSCNATRRPPSRHESTQVAPNEPTITDGGWRPVIDSRSSYEPSTHEDGDQTIDLVPPPVGGVKSPIRTGVKPLGRKPEVHTHKHEPHSHKHESHFHKHEPHVHSHDPHVHKHEPHHHKHETHVHKTVTLKGVSADLKVSETRGPTSSSQSDGPTGPARPMRFPDQKPRSPASVRPRRPPMIHHHHHHHQTEKHQTVQSQSDQLQNFNVRQNSFAGSESTQQLRFRPSPQVPAAYENPYPGWLVQQDELQPQQQQQVFYNNDPTGLLQFQQTYSSPNAQYQLAIAQQQPELASQFQQSDLTAQYKQPQQPIPTLPAQNAFIPGTATVFGNAGLFNVNPDLQKDQGNLFLAPSATEPSIHENEVPQGPQVFVSQTRGRPQRPTLFENNIEIQKLTADPTVPTVQHQENSDYRPRRPRPPSGIQAQLETARRPITDEHVASTRPTEPSNEQAVSLKTRHPRPPSTEPPSWSHPMLDTTRVRIPRPPQQNGEVTNKRVRRPRPPVQEQTGEIEQQDERPRRPLRPVVDDQDWKPSTPIPEPPQHLRPQEESEVPAERHRRPRPPPPVQEQLEDDIVRPTFNLRPRRPQPSREPDEEVITQRPRRPRPPTATQPPQEEEPEAQEVVDDTVNVRPQRPRPAEDDKRPRIRRPRPPLDVAVKHRRPRPPTEVQEQRRPVYQSVEEEETEVIHGKLLPSATRGRHEDSNQDYAVVEQQESLDEVVHEPELFIAEDPIDETLPESTIVPATTTTHAPLPTFPPKRRRPIKPEQQENMEETTENYPPQYIQVTSEAITTPSPTTTNSPTTTRSLINSRLRARLNMTRPRFGLGVKERLNRLSSLKKTEDETPSTTAPAAVEEPFRTKPRTRESYRPKLAITQQPEVERTSFKPTFNRARPTNKFSSRYRPTTEEPDTTTNSQDATRRASEDIYAAKERKPFPGLKNYIPEKETIESDVPVTSVSFSVSEVTTDAPAPDELTTTPMTLNEDAADETTEVSTTAFPEEVVPTPAEDFSLARRVTDLTSSATAFKPLSFFSAVPADGKSRSQLSSRFTMATEDPILPLEAFFPTFPSKSSKEVGEHDEDHSK
ncbi:hypothetical protein B566_EDAN011597 [Ephemera danica]|nr:hypothetical protein B566_EDAN011597 [Ephemera danica]